MIIKFTKKEALTCSFCSSDKPSFQMVSLSPFQAKMEVLSLRALRYSDIPVRRVSQVGVG
jgi:hypothetical protein